jgi:putative acetyltransferase
MARAQPKIAMRPFLPQDAPVLIEIFRTSVEELTADDYDDAQRAAWASAADDEEDFTARLKQRLTLIGTMDGSSVGFAALDGADIIDMLYVHPVAAGYGVGSMLLDALERLAASRGAGKLSADVSDNAQAFFKKHGYVPRQRNSVPVADEWLANTTMEKQLAPAPKRSAS